MHTHPYPQPTISIYPVKSVIQLPPAHPAHSPGPLNPLNPHLRGVHILRTILLLLLLIGLGLLCTSTPAHGQSAPAPSSLTLLSAPPPPPVSGISASNLGGTGNNSFCWWVVPTYPIGDGPISTFPACLNQINGPSAANTVRISWPATPSATSYRVIRAPSPNLPIVGGVCVACSITTTTSTSYTDTGTAGTNYTANTGAGANFILSLDNLTTSAAIVRTQLGNTNYTLPQVVGAPVVGNCVVFAAGGNVSDSGTACTGGGGGGAVTGPATSTNNAIALWNGVGGTVLKDSAVTLPTGALVGAGQSNTYSTGVQDFSSATSFLVRTSAGYAPTVTSHFGMDSTAGRLVFGFGGVTRTGATQGTTIGGTGECAQYDSNGALTGAGTPCATSTPTPTPGYTPSSLLYGGGVEWTGLLNFTVGAASYQINGVAYTSTLTTLTLAVADPTNPRIDMIVLNTSGVAAAVTGTPAASPSQPVVDPSTQLALAFVYVAANGTTPANITSTNIYRENVEWTTSTVGGTINTASTNFPYEGTKSIEGTSVVAGNYVQLVAPSPFTLSTFNTLLLYVRSKASWPTPKSLQITWFNGSTQVGTTAVLKSGQFGFDSSITSTYQQINISLLLFGLTGATVDRVRITCAGGGGSIGFYLDAISLQTGIIPPTTSSIPSMIWRGTWNSTASYAVNDVVVRNGVSFVALVANSNSTPTQTNTNWQGVATTSRTFGGTFASSDGVTALTAGATSYFTIPYACTITAWNIVANAGTATVDIWKIATGTAIPTIANTITAAAIPALSSGTAGRSTTLTGWTTAVAANDIVGINLKVVATATYVNLTVECVQ